MANDWFSSWRNRPTGSIPDSATVGRPGAQLDATVVPLPERTSGPVFPYRGQEQHGVPATYGAHDLDGQYVDQEVVDAYKVEPEEIVIDPIPVIVVNRSGNERRTIRTAQFPVGTTPTRIAQRNDGRSRLRIKNIETSAGFTVWITGDVSNSSATFDGYPLGPLETVEILTEDEVYCVSDGQGSAGFNRVAVLFENTIILD